MALVCSQKRHKYESPSCAEKHRAYHPARETAQVKGNRVDVKDNSVDVKDTIVDVKGNIVDVKGNRVDVKGNINIEHITLHEHIT
eukprot:1179276-Prorocentrum_minimum.AAC.2